MALHTDLPIHKTGVQLLSLAIKVQEQMPRGVKRSLGDKISQHCVEMLDLMALANATQRLQDLPKADLHASANSYFGLLRQAPASHHDRALIANVLRKRDKAVSGDLTKTYRGSAQ